MRVQPTKRRVGISFAALIGVAALTAALVSVASAGPVSQSQKGGTYRVGWESSFGWTNSFDPTGEYLANGFVIYSNLMLRNLVTFNHVAGPAGNIVVPDLATSVPKPTNGGQDVHVQAQERSQVGAAREPCDHLAGRPVRSRAAGAAEERSAVRLLLQRHPGVRGVRQGREEVDLRHQDAEREDHRPSRSRSPPETSRSA